MLALIGLGLGPKDISAGALEFIRSADEILLESYTSIPDPGAIAFIVSQTGAEPVRTLRSDFEDNLKTTVARAKSCRLAILVIGDPLVATTHHIILDEARKQDVGTAVFHSSSIFSAGIGESGLDIYRFGPTTTVPFWSEKYRPTSFIDTIARNLSNSQHTLVLLDIDQKNGMPMSISYAAQTLSAADVSHAIAGSSPVIVLADIGRASQCIISTKFTALQDLSKRLEGKTMALIFPAKLNFAEEEAVGRFEKALSGLPSP